MVDGQFGYAGSKLHNRHAIGAFCGAEAGSTDQATVPEVSVTDDQQPGDSKVHAKLSTVSGKWLYCVLSDGAESGDVTRCCCDDGADAILKNLPNKPSKLLIPSPATSLARKTNVTGISDTHARSSPGPRVLAVKPHQMRFLPPTKQIIPTAGPADPRLSHAVVRTSFVASAIYGAFPSSRIAFSWGSD